MRLHITANPERLRMTGHKRRVAIAPIGLKLVARHLGSPPQIEYQLDHLGEPTGPPPPAGRARRRTWLRTAPTESQAIDTSSPATPCAPSAPPPSKAEAGYCFPIPAIQRLCGPALGRCSSPAARSCRHEIRPAVRRRGRARCHCPCP